MAVLAVIGTDTGVGKTRVTAALVLGLRALGQRVWLHKPVACGGWDGGSSEDGRALRALCGDGQDPATVCPREFPEPCSPHLAAAAAGVELRLDGLATAARRLAAGGRGQGAGDGRAAASGQRPAASGQQPALLLETAGGLLAPLTAARETNADLLAALAWPAILVTRPHLGTLNHTCLTVNEARRRGIRLLGLAINHHAAVDDGLAVRSAPGELAALTGLPVLATLPWTPDPAPATGLARAVLAALADPPAAGPSPAGR